MARPTQTKTHPHRTLQGKSCSTPPYWAKAFRFPQVASSSLVGLSKRHGRGRQSLNSERAIRGISWTRDFLPPKYPCPDQHGHGNRHFPELGGDIVAAQSPQHVPVEGDESGCQEIALADPGRDREFRDAGQPPELRACQ